MIIWLLIGISILLFLTELNIKVPRKRRSIKSFKVNKYAKKIETSIKKYKLINKLKDLYSKKLLVINQKDNTSNQEIAVLIIIGIVGISTIGTSLFLILGIKMWYVLTIIQIVNMYICHALVSLFLDKKIRKIYMQFPQAVQLFTDVYITSKNIKTALDVVYKEMPSEIGNVFQRLSRELSSGYEYEKNIKNFAKELDYTWGYAFADILIMSYQGAGNISEELIFLNELVNDDIKNKKESNSELAGNKMMFIVLNGLTAVVFSLNIGFNPIAKQLYFYTIQGNNFISFWVISITLGFLVSNILEKA